MTVKIYVFRHTESTDNRDWIFSGIRGVDLTREGMAEAKLITRKFKDLKIDLAFTSPMKRTGNCLKVTLQNHPETKLIIDKRLIERDYGKLSGLSKKEYSQKHPRLFPIYRRSYDVSPPGGESMEQVDKRVTDFIGDMIKIIKENKAKVIVICAHSNSMRPIRKYFENLTNQEMMQIESGLGDVFIYSMKV